MKKGTIFRNLWAGHETYFVYQGSIPAKGMRSATSYGYKLMLYPHSETWKVSKASYYTHDLENDREHFPVVGQMNMDKVMTDAILNAVQKPEEKSDYADYVAKEIREMPFTMSVCLSEEECKGMNRAKELIARYVETALRTDETKEG